MKMEEKTSMVTETAYMTPFIEKIKQKFSKGSLSLIRSSLLNQVERLELSVDCYVEESYFHGKKFIKNYPIITFYEKGEICSFLKKVKEKRIKMYGGLNCRTFKASLKVEPFGEISCNRFPYFFDVDNLYGWWDYFTDIIFPNKIYVAAYGSEKRDPMKNLHKLEQFYR